MNFPFLKEETFDLRTQCTFIGNTCEMYIPASWFDKNDISAPAAIVGDRIRTIGLFYFKADGQLYSFQQPVSIEFQFTEFEKRKFSLKPGIPEMEFSVYILKHGDAFIYDILHKRNIDDFGKAFMKKLLENGKLPAYISYDDALPTFINAMMATHVDNLGVSCLSIEILLSELYRDKHSLQDPFRLKYNGSNKYGYRMISIRKVPQLNSTFTAMSAEDITTQMASSIAKYRDPKLKGTDKESPIEKILKY